MIYLLEPIASFQIDSSEELFKKKIAPPERSITALLEKRFAFSCTRRPISTSRRTEPSDCAARCAFRL